MAIAAAVFFLLTLSLGLLTIRVERKRRALLRLIKIAERPVLATGTMEGAAIGTAAASLSIYDVYASCKEHGEILETLERRFPHALDSADPFDWLRRLSELSSSGPSSLQAYVNNYVGMAGEDAARAYLEDDGYHVESFAQLNHPHSDLQAVMDDGTAVEFSVKSYDSTSLFMRAVEEHPQSTHYVVNSELYHDLQAEALVENLDENGITVLDGGFSHEIHSAVANEAFADILDAGDIDDQIPGLACLLFGVRLYSHIRGFRRGQESGYEVLVDLPLDIARIGISSMGAYGVAQIGAMLGTAVAPGLGSIIGGGIGAALGYMGVNRVVQFFRERIKWGAIIDAVDHFGKKYKAGLPPGAYKNIANRLFQCSSMKDEFRLESKLADRYAEELSIWRSRTPTLSAALTYLHTMNLSICVRRAHRAARALGKRLWEFCGKAATAAEHDAPRVLHRRLFGELIIANRDLLLGPALNPEDKLIAAKYDACLAKAPNHPYRFTIDPKEIVEGLAVNTFIQELQFEQHPVPARPTWLYMILSLALAGLGLSIACWLSGVSLSDLLIELI
jgi:hypothetical protein